MSACNLPSATGLRHTYDTQAQCSNPLLPHEIIATATHVILFLATKQNAGRLSRLGNTAAMAWAHLDGTPWDVEHVLCLHKDIIPEAGLLVALHLG